MQKPKSFRAWNPEQTLLLPPSPVDWLPANHLVFFLLDLAAELDLEAIYAVYRQKDPRGEKAYDPRMMVVLLLYAYCVGLPSSRKIEKACWEDAAFRVLTGSQQPDHSRISDFRRRHLDALAGLFVQVLRLCQKAGLVSLGQVALDGTKIRANASKHKAMSARCQLRRRARQLRQRKVSHRRRHDTWPTLSRSTAMVPGLSDRPQASSPFAGALVVVPPERCSGAHEPADPTVRRQCGAHHRHLAAGVGSWIGG